MNAKVLILARAFRRRLPASGNVLREAGCEPVEGPEWRPLLADELAEVIPGVDAVIAGGDRFERSVFESADRLRVVSRWGIGVDAVDLEAATDHGVVVTNTPGLTANAVADFSFMLMLALARNLCTCMDIMRDCRWDEIGGVDVWRKTLGLIGFGAIGRAVARRARGFEMRVLAYDIAPDHDAADALGVGLVGLDQLLRESDFVSLHASGSDENEGMIGDRELALMKPSACLINTARGRLVDESALAEALRSGQIAGAAMDAHRSEPPGPDYCLASAPNCILTPHSAFNSAETVEAVNRAVAENVLTVLRGERPEHVVNPEVYGS